MRKIKKSSYKSLSFVLVTSSNGAKVHIQVKKYVFLAVPQSLRRWTAISILLSCLQVLLKTKERIHSLDEFILLSTTFIIPSLKWDHAVPETIILSFHSSFRGLKLHEFNPTLVIWWRKLVKASMIFQTAVVKHRNLLPFVWWFSWLNKIFSHLH